MSATESPARPSAKRLIVLGAASVLVALGFAYVLHAGALPALPHDIGLDRVGRWNLLAYSAMWLCVVLIKATRWSFQLSPMAQVPLTRVISASIIGYAATLALPFRSGEVVRPAVISRGTSISFFAAFSTSATERVIDAVFASTILLVSLSNAQVITPLPDSIGELQVPTKVVTVFGYGAAVVSLSAVSAAIGFYYFQTLAVRLIRNTLGRLSEKLGEVVVRVLSEFARGLEFLVSSRHASRYLLTSAAYWIAYWLSTWFLLTRSGFEEASWAQTGVVVGTLAFGMSLPNAPGFFGSFQIAVYASLALFFQTTRIQTDGAIFVFWLYLLQLGWIFVLAPVALVVERRARKAVA